MSILGQVHLGDDHLGASSSSGDLPGGEVQVVLGAQVQVEVLHRGPGVVEPLPPRASSRDAGDDSKGQTLVWE